MARARGERGWAGVLALLPLALGAVTAAADESGTAARPHVSADEPATAARPNVLLVSIDTLRADHVGAYGAPFPTPTLDRLASEGVLLEQACTPTPSTGPAHASLLSGLYPWNHGTLRNAVPLDPRLPTLADRLHAQGLRTAAFVSSYVLDKRFGFHQGFDTFVFEPDQELAWNGRGGRRFYATRGETTTERAMHWITENAGRRFFLWVHYFDPHTPYEAPPGYAVSPEVPISLEGKPLGKRSNPDALRRRIRAYRGEVVYVDAQLGRLIERLRILGLLDRSVVVVTADHGEGLGDHGVLEHGVNLFDELVRVPLLLRAPGLPVGRRLQGSAQLEDLVPTILALAGVPAPEGLDGVDLGPWLRGDVEQSPREVVLGRRRPYRGKPDQYFERRWPAKWIGSLDDAGIALDLEADPRELQPTPGKGVPPPLRKAVEGGAGEVRVVDPDPEVRRALEALGYGED